MNKAPHHEKLVGKEVQDMWEFSKKEDPKSTIAVREEEWKKQESI